MTVNTESRIQSKIKVTHLFRKQITQGNNNAKLMHESKPKSTNKNVSRNNFQLNHCIIINVEEFLCLLKWKHSSKGPLKHGLVPYISPAAGVEQFSA